MPPRAAAIAFVVVGLFGSAPAQGRTVMYQRVRPMLRGAVDTSPRRTARREWAATSWATKEAEAQRLYDQTWDRAASLYGQAGEPPPPVRFVDSAANPDQYSPGAGVVELNSDFVGELDRPKLLFPKGRADARETLLHEWAHYFQNPQILSDPNPYHREEAAELFATYWGHRLFGADPMKPGPLPYYGRRAASRDLASTYGPGYWRRAQFR